MRKRVLSFSIIVTLIGGVFGISAAEGSSLNANMPLCCRKARSSGNTAEASVARLCCKLNCSEPASGGSTSSSNSSGNNSSIPVAEIVPTPAHFPRFAIRNLPRDASHSSAANPKYIQHLALLI